jgi:amino acid efflux transporter
MNKLKLWQSIPLGIGSIMGSGILFLPSITYKISGPDVLISWLLILGLCIPGIWLFNDLVKLLPVEKSSLKEMIELGLGKEAGSSIYLILLGTVVFGMPSSAIVAGSYLKGLGVFFEVGVAYFLIFIAIFINYFGLKFSSIASLIVSFFIVAISVLVIVKTNGPIESYNVFTPSYSLHNIYSGAVMAFWAFAGFENLTFMYHRFQNPKRDLMISVMISILVCGLLYIGLVANFSRIVPFHLIDEKIGLLQMAKLSGDQFLGIIISSFAVLCVGINLISWTGGISQLLVEAGEQNIVPKSFCKNEKTAVLSLGLMFFISLTFGLLSENIFETILRMVSTNFLLIYLLVIVSFIFVTKNRIKKIIAMTIALGILMTLSSSSFLLLYPLLIFVFTVLRIYKHA